jgi:hypothetical protein
LKVFWVSSGKSRSMPFAALQVSLERGFSACMSRLRELQAAVEVARSNLQHIRQTCHRAQQQVHRAQQSSIRRTISHDQCLSVAVVVLLEADDDVCVVCARRIIGGKLPSVTLDEVILQNLIREVRAEPELLASAADAIVKREYRHRGFCLARMIAESKVVLWLYSQNAKGVAVSGKRLACELKRTWPPRGKSVLAMKFLMRATRSRWFQGNVCKRLRREWGVSWKKLSARSAMTPEDIAARVPHCRNSFGLQLWVRFLDPFLGSS